MFSILYDVSYLKYKNLINVSVLNCICIFILWYYNINICLEVVNYIVCLYIFYFLKLFLF